MQKELRERERSTFIANIVQDMNTLVGKPLVESPSITRLLAGGRRVSTLLSRSHHQSVFPTSMLQVTEYVKVGLSDPCNRGGRFTPVVRVSGRGGQCAGCEKNHELPGL